MSAGPSPLRAGQSPIQSAEASSNLFSALPGGTEKSCQLADTCARLPHRGAAAPGAKSSRRRRAGPFAGRYPSGSAQFSLSSPLQRKHPNVRATRSSTRSPRCVGTASSPSPSAACAPAATTSSTRRSTHNRRRNRCVRAAKVQPSGSVSRSVSGLRTG